MNNGINNYGGWNSPINSMNSMMTQPNSLSYPPNTYNYRNQQFNIPTSTPMFNQSQNNIIWVNGKENARSMQLPPNSTVILLDNETQKFYIKTTDDIGLGKIRVFSYSEEPDVDTIQKTGLINTDLDLSNYVTKEQFQKVIGEIKDNEQFISTADKSTTNSKQQHKPVNKQF